MLTTTDLFQNATSSFLPWLLMIISWYCMASAVRAFFDLLIRQRKKQKIEKNFQVLAKHQKKMEFSAAEAAQKAQSLPTYGSGTEMEGEVRKLKAHLKELSKAVEQDIQESLLDANQVGKHHRLFVFIEVSLFSALAIFTFLKADPLPFQIGKAFWWMHFFVPFLFLCVILRARRILMLFPLSVLALFAWQTFSFITSFQQTLEASTDVSTITIERLDYSPNKRSKVVTFSLEFPKGKVKKKFTMPISHAGQIQFLGNVFRVSPEVLLFGGKNIITLDKVYSDAIPLSQAPSISDKDEIPPLYQWESLQLNSLFLEKQKKKVFHWLWGQFFLVQKKKNLGRRRQLKAVICPPPNSKALHIGQKFVLKLRHVADLECHDLPTSL